MTVLDDAPTRNGADHLATTAALPAPLPLPTETGTAVPIPGPASGGVASPSAVMVDPAPSTEAAVVDEARRHALRFFWMWLLFATIVSIGGNVIHAWMTAPEAHLKLLAAIAAAIPPTVLLGASHSVALLFKTRRQGYRRVDAIVLAAALALTVGVAACAFAMSFFALRDLIVMLGVAVGTAWLWPVAVDLSLICSTLALLSLTSPHDDARGGRPRGLSAAAVGSHALIQGTPVAPAVNTGPVSPAERRVWWESIAGIVREQMPDVPKVAGMSNGELGEILERMYDHGESGRDIVNSTSLHNREVKPIREIVDGVLERTAPPR